MRERERGWRDIVAFSWESCPAAARPRSWGRVNFLHCQIWEGGRKGEQLKGGTAAHGRSRPSSRGMHATLGGEGVGRPFYEVWEREQERESKWRKNANFLNFIVTTIYGDMSYSVSASKNLFMEAGTLRRPSPLIWINGDRSYSVPAPKYRLMKMGTSRRSSPLTFNRGGLFRGWLWLAWLRTMEAGKNCAHLQSKNPNAAQKKSIYEEITLNGHRNSSTSLVTNSRIHSIQKKRFVDCMSVKIIYVWPSF